MHCIAFTDWLTMDWRHWLNWTCRCVPLHYYYYYYAGLMHWLIDWLTDAIDRSIDWTSSSSGTSPYIIIIIIVDWLNSIKLTDAIDRSIDDGLPPSLRCAPLHYYDRGLTGLWFNWLTPSIDQLIEHRRHRRHHHHQVRPLHYYYCHHHYLYRCYYYW